MTKPDAPQLDMNLEGEFVAPPSPPVTTQIMAWAILVAVVAGAVCLAAFALWLALIILPVALGASAVAWIAYRYQSWRGQKSLGGERNLFRP